MTAQPDLILQLVQATEDVFKAMIFKRLEPVLPPESDGKRPRSNVVGIVGFAGSISGLVAFYSTLDAAQEIAGSMLGMDPADVNGEMPDAIGEVTNMIAGGFRLRMAEQGETLALSIPSVTVGSDFYTRFATDVRRVMCPFKMGNRDVSVELILTRS